MNITYQQIEGKNAQRLCSRSSVRVRADLYPYEVDKQYDVILGCDLCYTPWSEDLVRVIQQYLKPNGRVYFCENAARKSVPIFFECLTQYDFHFDVVDNVENNLLIEIYRNQEIS